MFLPRICVLVLKPEPVFPRRAEEAEMNLLGRALHVLRVWTGLADASDSHLTPSHGWLLPAPSPARQLQLDYEAQRAALDARDPRA